MAGSQAVKIGIDLTAAWRQRTGANGYGLDLTRALLALDSSNDHFVYFGPEVHPDLRPFDGRFVPRILNTRNELLCKAALLPALARKDHLDVCYFPVFPPAPWQPGPFAFCIHDATPWLYPQTMTAKGRWYFRVTAALASRRARGIITYSRSVRDEIARCLNLPSGRIVPIPLAGRFGVSTETVRCSAAEEPPACRSLGRFLLSVGTIEPRKNLETALAAFRRVLREEGQADLHWVVAGRRGWGYRGFIQAVDASGVGDRLLFLGHVSDEQLRWLYQHAQLLLYPSTYEGFGLPPLEAMECGCPVVASNIPAVSEVVADAGILVDPSRQDAFADALCRILRNAELKAELVRAGRARSLAFSWDRTARETLEVLQRAAI
jgi:glycosyltransferase involved in cell wall biosynthesis